MVSPFKNNLKLSTCDERISLKIFPTVDVVDT